MMVNTRVVGFFGVGGCVVVATAVLLRRRKKRAPEEGPPVVVVFASVSGASRRYAERLAQRLRSDTRRPVVMMDASVACEPWDALLNGAARDLALVVSTHDGRAPEKARSVLESALDELVSDFRVGALALRGRRFAVLGLGSSAYDDFCTASKRAEKQLRRLGAARVASEALDDTRDDQDAKYQTWETRVVRAFQRVVTTTTEGVVLSTTPHAPPFSEKKEKEEDPAAPKEEEDSEDDDENDDDDDGSPVVDVEDVASTFAKASSTKASPTAPLREMVTEKQAKSLKKEGYKLIGSHSAVKMCRWTKHQLRGRGGCYKHTFYGITSSQCMEATPSLACANKCVFCIAEGAKISLGGGGNGRKKEIPIEDFGHFPSDALPSVLALDESGKRLTSQQVTAFTDVGRRPCVEIVLRDDDGGGKRPPLVCTEDHRIRTFAGEWVKAGDLTAGVQVACFSPPTDHSRSSRGDDDDDRREGAPRLTEAGRATLRRCLQSSWPLCGVGVASVRRVGVRRVYDLTVPLESSDGLFVSEGSFVANGQVVHNCWRHHKNPVGREWRWKADGPEFIVEEAVQKHVQMIKEAKGIPGVKEDRWRAALTVRHCALSLVGEPIMYPKINELLGELHRRRISTFLVTNGQFPDAIRTLVPVTQLYVSVDATDEASLKKIDRPLFKDAWHRLNECLLLLREKKQRTVARLTIVNGYNADDVDGYATLLAKGVPTLIEIKGVTFCGKSDASDLTMESCPWHHEILDLSTRLCAKLNDELRRKQARRQSKDDDDQCGAAGVVNIEYGVACSHKHSVSVVLARKDELFVDGCWETWIDYDKFHALVDKGEPFSVADYRAPTPPWALAGAEEDGFDPADVRLYKKKANGKSR